MWESSYLTADKNVVLAAVMHDGSALRYASPDLKANKEVVLADVMHDGSALRYASAELKADKEVVLAAVTSCRSALKYGSALYYASVDLKADKEVVLAAVMHDGSALQFASVDLKADKEVVLTALAKSIKVMDHMMLKKTEFRQYMLDLLLARRSINTLFVAARPKEVMLPIGLKLNEMGYHHADLIIRRIGGFLWISPMPMWYLENMNGPPWVTLVAAFKNFNLFEKK